MSRVPASAKSPAVSVVLPVYNGADYVAGAVQSILDQSWRDFELIVIDDGSTDDSAREVARLHDPRIRFLRQANRGLAATLNRGISLASGRYIARQDHDDLSHPERLEKQVWHLEANPACTMVGTCAEIWNQKGPTGRTLSHPAQSPLLKLELLFNNPFVHSSVMIRRDVLLEVGGYSEDPDRQPPEDYELWSRLARGFEVGNLPETLLIYREVAGSMSRRADRHFWLRVLTICSENLQHALGPGYDPVVIRRVASLAVDYDFSGEIEPPSARELARVMADLVLALEKSYPAHREAIRSRMRDCYHGMLSGILRRDHNRLAAQLLTRFFKYRHLGAMLR